MRASAFLKTSTGAACRAVIGAAALVLTVGRAETVEPMPMPVLEVNIDGVWRAPPTKVLAWGWDYAGGALVNPPVDLQDMTAVALGIYHGMALLSDGTVRTWGSNQWLDVTVPAGLGGVVGIASGDSYCEALKSDGTVVHWGRDSDMASYGPPPGLSGVMQISARGWHSLAVTGDGKVVAWGTIRSGWSYPPAVLAQAKTVAVAAGTDHSLALTDQGTVIAWGWNASGQCNVPPGLSDVVAIAAGNAHSLALKKDGTVVQWGSNQYGQTSQPANLDHVVSISAGAYHNLALKADGTVVAWGRDRIFTNGLPMNQVPPAVGGVVAVAAGDTCSMIVARTVDMPRGTPSTQYTLSPELRLLLPSGTDFLSTRFDMITRVPEGLFGPNSGLSLLMRSLEPRPFRLVFQGSGIDRDAHTRMQIFSDIHYPMQQPVLAVDVMVSACRAKLSVVDGVGDDLSVYSKKKLVSWGSSNGVKKYLPRQLNGDTHNYPDALGVVGITSSSRYNAAWEYHGQATVWDFEKNVYLPLPFPVVSMSAGSGFLLSLNGQGKVSAFGGDAKNKVPATLANVMGISAGGGHSLAVKTDGTVVAWGENRLGQCTVPKGLANVVAVAAGSDASLALKADGKVVGWGRGTYEVAKVPAGLSGVTAIAAGVRHALALKSDGTVVTWGHVNLNTGLLNVPPGLKDVMAIAASDSHSVALKADGTVAAWGSSIWGLTAVPPRLSGVLAIAAAPDSTTALVEAAGDFGNVPVGQKRTHRLAVRNTGRLRLDRVFCVVEGPDAGAFLVDERTYRSVGSVDAPLTVSFIPGHQGRVEAVLKVFSNDLRGAFSLPISGTGGPTPFSLTAAKTGTHGAAFTYAPLRMEAATGLMLQRLTFLNTTGEALPGLRLSVSRLAAGISLYSSSGTATPGTLEVIYNQPLASGELVAFDLVYFDPYRRTAASISPLIKVEPLDEPVPRAPALLSYSRQIPVRSVRDTAAGALVEFPTVRGKLYVVEYSDDRGQTWSSAVHRLTGNGATLRWIDRGQPETYYKPVSRAAWVYRVREL